MPSAPKQAAQQGGGGLCLAPFDLADHRPRDAGALGEGTGRELVAHKINYGESPRLDPDGKDPAAVSLGRRGGLKGVEQEPTSSHRSSGPRSPGRRRQPGGPS